MDSEQTLYEFNLVQGKPSNELINIIYTLFKNSIKKLEVNKMLRNYDLMDRYDIEKLLQYSTYTAESFMSEFYNNYLNIEGKKIYKNYWETIDEIPTVNRLLDVGNYCIREAKEYLSRVKIDDNPFRAWVRLAGEHKARLNFFRAQGEVFQHFHRAF